MDCMKENVSPVDKCDPVGSYDSPESRSESIACLCGLIVLFHLMAFFVLKS